LNHFNSTSLEDSRYPRSPFHEDLDWAEFGEMGHLTAMDGQPMRKSIL